MLVYDTVVTFFNISNCCSYAVYEESSSFRFTFRTSMVYNLEVKLKKI